MTFITRFAPSPSGALHTGNLRTALFNWLFSKHHNGKFMLRIEDTDKERSTQENIDIILHGLAWMGLKWDDEIVYQSSRINRHAEIAYELIKKGNAYYCYSTHEEIEKFRSEHPNHKFQSPWRDNVEKLSKPTTNGAIRLKVNNSGHTTIVDQIQGEITVENAELDDMIILRSDGTPTYMLAVVVDDFDMGITHIIRGDDHLTNAFRQKQIYDAMGWSTPIFAHIPLIHDSEGKKLSKRKGALGIDAYLDMGYLPDAVFNYLLKLGWSHGDDELIDRNQAIEWFDLPGINKSPARFDIEKLNFINAHYLKQLSDIDLFNLIKNKLPEEYNDTFTEVIIKGLSLLKNRAHTLIELANSTIILIKKLDELDEKSLQVLNNGGAKINIDLLPKLEALSEWHHDSLLNCCNEYALEHSLKPALVMQSLRAGVIGTFASPGIIDVMEILGKVEVIKRLKL